MMNRINRLNSNLILRSLLNNNNNYTKKLFLNKSSSSLSLFKFSNKSINQIRIYSTTNNDNKNNNSNNEDKNNDDNNINLEDQFPHPGVAKPNSPFSMNLDKYKTNETIDDLNADHLIYQSNRENLFKGSRYFLASQSILGVSSPIIAYFNQIEMRTVLFLSIFSAWALSFQFIGEKMASCFGMRIYREPGSDYIKLCHFSPSLKVLKIPLEDIQLSKISEKGSPYILLENGALFFFEQSGDLLNVDEFSYILSGEEYNKKMKKLEQDEYKKYFEQTSTTTEDLENTNKLIDLEMELINKKLEDAKKEQDIDHQHSKKDK